MGQPTVGLAQILTDWQVWVHHRISDGVNEASLMGIAHASARDSDSRKNPKKQKLFSIIPSDLVFPITSPATPQHAVDGPEPPRLPSEISSI